jgi:hypothetical protein
MVVAVFIDAFQSPCSDSLASSPWFAGFSSAFHPSENLVDMTKLQML